MKPIDYIYKNIDCLNTAILKQLIEDAGENVSENIYNYLMETTWNTNPAILKEFGLDVEKSKEGKGSADTIILLDESRVLKYTWDEDEGKNWSYFENNVITFSNVLPMNTIVHCSIYYDDELKLEEDVTLSGENWTKGLAMTYEFDDTNVSFSINSSKGSFSSDYTGESPKEGTWRFVAEIR